MATRLTARRIAETAEVLRAYKQADVLQVEYTKSGRLRLLSKIRFGRTESGRPSKKTMDCIDDGTERTYDKAYDFEVTAFIGVNGSRMEL